MNESPTLRELAALKEEILSSLRCAMPGVVESFSPQTQTAVIRPLLKRRTDLPLLRDVPVFFPGTRSNAVTWPVSAGDECLVVFADMDIDRWFETGEAKEVASARRHDLSDAFAFVGFRSGPGALKNLPGDPSFFGMTEPGIDAKLDTMEAGIDAKLDRMETGFDTKLSTLETSIDTKLAGKSNTGHKHAAGDITSGTLPVARGGTGAATAAAARTALDVPSNAAVIKAGSSTYSTPGLTLDGVTLIPHVTSYTTCAKNTEVAIGKLRNGAVIIVVSDTYGADVFIKSSPTNFYGDAAPLKNNVALHALEHNVSVENKGGVTVGITVIA